MALTAPGLTRACAGEIAFNVWFAVNPMFLKQFKQFWDSLAGKSVVYIILTLAATIVIITAVSLVQGRDLLQTQVRQHLAVTADLVAASIDDKLRVRFNAINDTARSLQMSESELFGGAAAARQRILPLTSLFDRVYLLDTRGYLRTDWPRSGKAGLNLADQDYFQNTSSLMTTLISKPFVSPVSGKPSLNFSAPVFDDDQRMIAILVGGLQLDHNALAGGLSDLQLGGSGYLAIATRGGTVLAHPDSKLIMQPVPPENTAVQMGLQGFEGATVARNPQQEEALYHFRQLNEAPWTVAVIMPTRGAYAAFGPFVGTALWASLILLLILALLSWAFFRRLLAPLSDLAHQIVARHTGERLQPVSAHGGAEVRYVAQTFNTIFDEREAFLQQTQEREAFFRTLSESAPLGILQTDILGRVIFLNPAFTAITGIGPGDGLDKNWLEGLHPEDRDAVRQDWLAALVEDRVFQSRFRIRAADGSMRWVEVLATKIEAEGTVLGYIASLHDITVEHRSQELLEVERRRSANILDTIAEGVVLTELDGNIRYLNSPARRYLACEEPVIGKSLFDNLEVDVEGVRHNADELLQLARLENLDVTVHNRRSESWELELTMLRTGRAGEEDQLVFVLRDDREKRRQEEKLTWEATHDALTGLANRRAFTGRLQDQIFRVQQGGDSAALILLDLDGFKPVNDQAGHLAGDQLLRELGQTMKRQVRKSDTVARLGGDEFAVILPGCTLARALELAESLRAAVADLSIEYEGRHYGVTASLGVTLVQPEEESSRSVVSRADEACYEAKARGRNVVAVA